MIVLDASIVVKLLTFETDARLAVERVAREPERIAPDWLQAEVANSLSKKVRYGGLPLEVARQGWEAVPAIVSDLFPSVPLLDAAMRVSVEIKHAFYDCLYLVLAVEKGCPMLTADAKFVNALAGTNYRQHVELLA